MSYHRHHARRRAHRRAWIAGYRAGLRNEKIELQGAWRQDGTFHPSGLSAPFGRGFFVGRVEAADGQTAHIDVTRTRGEPLTPLWRLYKLDRVRSLVGPMPVPLTRAHPVTDQDDLNGRIVIAEPVPWWPPFRGRK